MQLFRTWRDSTGDADPEIYLQGQQTSKFWPGTIFPISFWNRTEGAKSRESTPKHCMDDLEQRLCGEVEGTYWARVRGALDVPPWLYTWLNGLGRVVLSMGLSISLYSKELNQELANISTKVAPTAKEGKDAEVYWSRALIKNSCSSSEKSCQFCILCNYISMLIFRFQMEFSSKTVFK